MQEKENVIDILSKAREAVREKNVVMLKNLSDRTVHSASIYQDEDDIAIAVIVYSLAKIIERERYMHYRQWPKFFNAYMESMKKAEKSLEKNNIEEFRRQLEIIREAINNLSGNFKMHIQEVFKKAEISKASRIYEHGISMEQTAKLLGITLWELADYAGKTGIGDVNLGITLDVRKRIKTAMEMFEN